MVQYAHHRHPLSLRQACKLFCIHPSACYYQPKPNQDEQVREHLAQLAEIHSRWGFWMMHHQLRNLNRTWNHKRVYRIYTQMGLNLSRKYKKRLPVRVIEPLVHPSAASLTWSMDFMKDGLVNGVAFRSLNIIDDYNRQALDIILDTSLTSERVIRELDQLIAWRGAPEKIRVDNGPKFIAQAMSDWRSCEK